MSKLTWHLFAAHAAVVYAEKVMPLTCVDIEVVSTKESSTDGREGWASHIFINNPAYNSAYTDCRKPAMSTQRKRGIDESLDKLLDMLRVKLATYIGELPFTDCMSV